VVSSGSEPMKSGSDSSEARCSSNDGGWGREAMTFFRPSDK